MSHDAAKVVLASCGSNHKDLACFDVDPASFPAGYCVSLASTGLPSLLKSAGVRYGISRGRSLSDHKKTSVQQAGLRAPVRLSLKRSTGTVTITNIANLVNGTDDTITIGGTAFTATDGAVTLGQATFDARVDVTSAAASLAAQINAHATASTKVYASSALGVVTLYAVVEGAATGHDVTTTYEQLGTGTGATVEQAALTGGSNTITDIAYVAKGAKMYINNITGKADIAHGIATISDAVYVTADITGIDEDGVEVAAAIVDFQGGL